MKLNLKMLLLDISGNLLGISKDHMVIEVGESSQDVQYLDSLLTIIDD